MTGSEPDFDGGDILPIAFICVVVAALAVAVIASQIQ